MKFILNIVICLLVISCSLKSEKKEQTKSKSKEITPKQFADLAEKHIGFWVSEEYCKALKVSNSTKIASETGNDDFYKISDSNSIINMNTHEGGAHNLLLMNSENKGQIFNSDTTESYSKVEFLNGIMLTKNKKYLKVPNGENGLNELVNDVFLSGIYLLNETEIEFKANGNLIGLDSIQSFKLNLDYNDVGMQYDKIYLQFNNEKEPRTYLYSYKSDTLIISNMVCKTQAENNDYCLEVEKGKIKYKLIRK